MGKIPNGAISEHVTCLFDLGGIEYLDIGRQRRHLWQVGRTSMP